MQIWSLILFFLAIHLPGLADQIDSEICTANVIDYAFTNYDKENRALITEIDKRLRVSPCLRLLNPDSLHFKKSLQILEFLGGKIYDLESLKENIHEKEETILADKIANQIFRDAFGINPHFEYDIYFTINNGKEQELRKQKLWQAREESELLYSTHGALMSLSISPDANYLLFQDRTNENEGSELTIYDHNNKRFGKIRFTDAMIHSRASFHPNCDLLSFSYRRKNQVRNLEQGIYQLDFKSNQKIPVELFDEVGIDMEPEYSPNGILYFISDHYNDHRWSPHVKMIANFSRVANDLLGKEFYEQRAPRVSVDGQFLAVNQPVSLLKEGKVTKLSSIGIFDIETNEALELPEKTLFLFKDSQDLQWLDATNISFLKSENFENAYASYNLESGQHFQWKSLQNIRKATRMFPINKEANCDLETYFKQ